MVGNFAIGHMRKSSIVHAGAALTEALRQTAIYSYQCCSQIVVISDGASWIQKIVEEFFPGAVHILDLYHIKEHV